MAEVFRAVARGARGFERTLVAKRTRADQSVSPANIRVLRSGGVKLLDFGVAKIHGDLQRGEDTATGVCKGKLPYLSPEQLREQPIDGRTDVFALGVVLWEALTGRRLFLDKS